eukprot:319380-Hanusia_phi.AAC.2
MTCHLNAPTKKHAALLRYRELLSIHVQLERVVDAIKLKPPARELGCILQLEATEIPIGVLLGTNIADIRNFGTIEADVRIRVDSSSDEVC